MNKLILLAASTVGLATAHYPQNGGFPDPYDPFRDPYEPYRPPVVNPYNGPYRRPVGDPYNVPHRRPHPYPAPVMDPWQGVHPNRPLCPHCGAKKHQQLKEVIRALNVKKDDGKLIERPYTTTPSPGGVEKAVAEVNPPVAEVNPPVANSGEPVDNRGEPVEDVGEPLVDEVSTTTKSAYLKTGAVLTFIVLIGFP